MAAVVGLPFSPAPYYSQLRHAPPPPPSPIRQLVAATTQILLPWRKPSRWKKLLRGAQCRLRVMQRRQAIIESHARDDVAKLLHAGQQQLAFMRAEQLIIDEGITKAYEILDEFCECIISNVRCIMKKRDCPSVINEAAASLIYASACRGDLPELHVLRKLLEKHYGPVFSTTTVNLLPGNHVNPQVKENLTQKSVPKDIVEKFMDQIAKDHAESDQLQPQPQPQQAQFPESGNDLPCETSPSLDAREPHCSRAASMPQECCKDGEAENVARSKSLPAGLRGEPHLSPSQVHPKLPDYDALEVKFKALKEAYLQNRAARSP